MRAIIFLTTFCWSYDIRLYPSLGVAVENKDNTIIVTNGYIKTKLRLEMNLPAVDSKVNATMCEAKSNGEFEKLVEAASTSFHTQIKKELDEFIDTNINIIDQPMDALDDSEEITVQDIKDNPLLCNDNRVKCQYFPVIDVNPKNENELMMRACYDVSLGHQSDRCKITNGTTICCSKKSSNNQGKCLTKDMERTIAMMARHELTDPSRVHKMGHGDIKQNRVNNYCVAVLSAEIKGVKSTIGGYTDVKGEAAKNLPIQTRRRRGTRSRRSTWEYYASGGFWTSQYIDNQIKKVQDVAEADNREIREALKKNSQTLLTLQADHKERERLQTAVCSTTEQLSKELILSELREAHSRLEFKADAILRTCANGEIPDQVDNSILTKICSSLTDSKFCFGNAVRSLFRCKLDKPLITMKVIGIATILTMHIPISEDYSAFQFHTIGVPYSSDALISTTNITNGPKVEVSEDTKISEKSNLDEVFKDFLDGLKDELQRSRRELVTTHHFLELKSVPDIVVRFNGDYISFSESSFIHTPWAKIVDYSQNIAENNECIHAIMISSVERIGHFCQLKLISSNYPCLVRNLGEIGYLVSSEEKTVVNEVTEKSISVFSSQQQEQCNTQVCIIPVGPSKKSFFCGKRQFFVGQHEDVDVNIEEAEIKSIDLTSLQKRKSDLNDMLFTGFKTLDKTPLTREFLRKTTTVGTIITLIFSLFVMCTVLRIGLIKTCQFLILSATRLCRRRFRSPRRRGVYRPRRIEEHRVKEKSSTLDESILTDPKEFNELGG